jgi:hypothetical protein
MLAGLGSLDLEAATLAARVSATCGRHAAAATCALRSLLDGPRSPAPPRKTPLT